MKRPSLSSDIAQLRGTRLFEVMLDMRDARTELIDRAFGRESAALCMRLLLVHSLLLLMLLLGSHSHLFLSTMDET